MFLHHHILVSAGHWQQLLLTEGCRCELCPHTGRFLCLTAAWLCRLRSSQPRSSPYIAQTLRGRHSRGMSPLLQKESLSLRALQNTGLIIWHKSIWAETWGLTLLPSDSSPVLALVRSDDERVSIAFAEGQHAVTCRQVRDVVPEVCVLDPIIIIITIRIITISITPVAVGEGSVSEAEAPQAVLSPGKHSAHPRPQDSQLTFINSGAKLKDDAAAHRAEERKTKPKHTQRGCKEKRKWNCVPAIIASPWIDF